MCVYTYLLYLVVWDVNKWGLIEWGACKEHLILATFSWCCCWVVSLAEESFYSNDPWCCVCECMHMHRCLLICTGAEFLPTCTLLTPLLPFLSSLGRVRCVSSSPGALQVPLILAGWSLSFDGLLHHTHSGAIEQHTALEYVGQWEHLKCGPREQRKRNEILGGSVKGVGIVQYQGFEGIQASNGPPGLSGPIFC